MSSSSGFSGQKPARMPERPKFSRTCSLLSQYLKEKGSFGDLSLGMTCNLESKEDQIPENTTMDLFPVSGQSSSTAPPKNFKAMELFPQQACLSSDKLNFPDSGSNKQPQTAQPMTIFYNGQVIVFNGIISEQAKEIMEFAKVCSPAMATGSVAAITTEPKQTVPPSMASDLPIARRASVQRFLEKRKDRISAKAPYQTQIHDSKPVESKSWLALAAQSQH